MSVTSAEESRRRALSEVLLKNEALKLGRRPATLVTLGFFAFVVALDNGEAWYGARHSAARSFGLLEAWSSVITELAQVGLVFGSILVILLVASEFSWRTARQNVIDGLSKEAWFAGKVLLIPMVALLVVGVQLAIGGGFALAGTDLSAVSAILPDRYQVSALGGVVLAFLGYGSLALTVALAVRGTGASIGVWFLYVTLVENLLGDGLARLGEWGADAARWLPVRVFNQLVSYLQHDPEARRQAVRGAAEQQGASAPLAWAWEALLPAAVGWIGALLIVSFFVFRRRDL